ncbi:MAG: succinylglutamate desuccinylase/aspartoacylase family protein [Parahaliea sp.]
MTQLRSCAFLRTLLLALAVTQAQAAADDESPIRPPKDAPLKSEVPTPAAKQAAEDQLRANKPTDNNEEEAEPAADESSLPKARNVALDKPISNAEAAAQTAPEPPPAPDETSPLIEIPARNPVEEKEKAAVPTPFILLATEVPAATSTRLAWAPNQSFEGIYSPTPVLVVNGATKGPTLCITAAVHGDELNGIETVRRVLYNLDANTLQGTVVGVPIVNLQGFHSSSRYLSDRRDLNRYFPGDPMGSSASRIAYSFFNEIVKHCSAVVDLHTGSFYRTNLPQLRGDLTNPQVVKLTQSFGSTVVLHSEGTVGTLRRAAVEAGIPAVTFEAGAPMVLSEDAVSHAVKGVRTLLNHLGMVSKFSLWGDPEPVYYNSTWQRAPEGGVVFSKVHLGQTVRRGDLLGTVTNPVTNVRTEIRSSYNGRILGMALNQVVQPGFATHHIGIQASQEQISDPEDVPVTVIEGEGKSFESGTPIDDINEADSAPAEEE